MKTLLSIALILIATTVFASPFLVSDPNPTALGGWYQFTGDSFFTNKAVEADGSLRYDLATIPTGTHNINVLACNMWGCSTPTPFSFNVSIPTAPSSLRLVP